MSEPIYIYDEHPRFFTRERWDSIESVPFYAYPKGWVSVWYLPGFQPGPYTTNAWRS